MGNTLDLGDMQIVMRPDGGRPPLRLLKCLAVIAMEMHQEWEKPIYMMAHKDKSKESCILSSLTVRDFLRRAGFPRARVASVQVVIVAERDGKELHSLAIGHPEAQGPGWNGHMVVVCNGWLIDATLFPVIRPQWPHLRGMMTVPLGDRTQMPKVLGLHGLAVLQLSDESGYSNVIAWADDPTNNTWRSAPDSQRSRRAPMVQHLLDTLQQAKD